MTPARGDSTACRRTKIVATVGPACDSPAMLEKLLKAGVNATRQNFSHGTRAYHQKLYRRVRAVSRRLGIPVACIQDLQGPRIRTGRFTSGRSIEIADGALVRLSGQRTTGDEGTIPVVYRHLAGAVKRGGRVLIADGAVELRVERVKGDEVFCRVIRGGVVGERKGINLPGADLRLPALTARDRADVRLGASLGFDYVALSFARTGRHVAQLRRLLKRLGGDAGVIAKVETPEAVRNLDGILDEADGIMVARGDLAVETSAGAVPVLQKKIIRRSNERSKIVITATEMLASMTEHPLPTRAEASDVANAVFDQTDATMLSAETASGSYPVESVRTMDDILLQAERFARGGPPSAFPAGRTCTHAAVHSAVVAAKTVEAACIAVFSRSGLTARLASEARPHCPVIALTPSRKTFRRLALLWGVTPVYLKQASSVVGLMKAGTVAVRATGLARRGDTVVFVAGTSQRAGATNLVRIDTI